MNESTLDDQIESARAYEELYVPALFAQWCPRVLDAVGLKPGDRVLDVACGTGVLAREAATRVGPGGFVAGVDPGLGMLAVAQERAPGVEWREGTAESLPYPERTFDAAVSQFGLMYFSDRRQGLREMARVLKPGGTLSLAVWDTLENSEAYPILVEQLKRLAGDAAANGVSAPFTLGDRDALLALFDQLGLASVNVETQNGTARFPSIRAMVDSELRGWLPVTGVVLDDELCETILVATEKALAEYVTADGSVVFNSPAHIVTGVV